jgi:hypothetical protein
MSLKAMGGVSEWGQSSRINIFIWISFHVSSRAFAKCLMMADNSLELWLEPIVRMTGRECPTVSLLAIRELPTLVLSRSNAATATLRPSLVGSPFHYNQSGPFPLISFGRLLHSLGSVLALEQNAICSFAERDRRGRGPWRGLETDCLNCDSGGSEGESVVPPLHGTVKIGCLIELHAARRWQGLRAGRFS